MQCLCGGGVAEWLNAAVLKTVRLERVSGVRIPPPPPLNQALLDLEKTANLSSEHSLCPNLSRCTELPAQRSAKPLGSTSTNKATVCETVVSAVGDSGLRLRACR